MASQENPLIHFTANYCPSVMATSHFGTLGPSVICLVLVVVCVCGMTPVLRETPWWVTHHTASQPIESSILQYGGGGRHRPAIAHMPAGSSASQPLSTPRRRHVCGRVRKLAWNLSPS